MTFLSPPRLPPGRGFVNQGQKSGQNMQKKSLLFPKSSDIIFIKGTDTRRPAAATTDFMEGSNQMKEIYVVNCDLNSTIPAGAHDVVFLAVKFS